MGLHTAPLLILATINLAGGPSYTRGTHSVSTRFPPRGKPTKISQ